MCQRTARKLTRRRLLQLGLAAGGLALVGCDGDDDERLDIQFEQQTTQAPQRTPAATTPASSSTPVALDPLPPPDCEDFFAFVDKRRAFDAACHPGDLVEINPDFVQSGLHPQYVRQAVEEPLRLMIAEALVEHQFLILVQSAYRAYDTQEELFQYYVDTIGQQEASRQSAEAGHSEHQLGTTVDLILPWQPELDQEFGLTPEGIWVEENCHRFGFVISYPRSKEAITGYIWEPWHIRWLGVPLATEVKNSNLSLTEYFRARLPLPPDPYSDIQRPTGVG